MTAEAETVTLRRVMWRAGYREWRGRRTRVWSRVHLKDPNEKKEPRDLRVLCGLLLDPNPDEPPWWDVPVNKDYDTDCLRCYQTATEKFGEGGFAIAEPPPPAPRRTGTPAAPPFERPDWWCNGVGYVIRSPHVEWDDRDWRSLYFQCPDCGSVRFRSLHKVNWKAYQQAQAAGVPYEGSGRNLWEGRIAAHSPGQEYAGGRHVRTYYRLDAETEQWVLVGGEEEG